MSNEMTRTAPERIYLQVADGGEDDEPFPTSHEDVSWCEDSCVENEVEYVRADLSAEPAEPMKVDVQAVREVIESLLRSGFARERMLARELAAAIGDKP